MGITAVTEHTLIRWYDLRLRPYNIAAVLRLTPQRYWQRVGVEATHHLTRNVRLNFWNV
jgi:hypothetical protein